MNFDNFRDSSVLNVKQGVVPARGGTRYLVTHEAWQGWVELNPDFEFHSEVLAVVPGGWASDFTHLCDSSGACRESSKAFQDRVDLAAQEIESPGALYDVVGIQRVRSRKYFIISLNLPRTSKLFRQLPKMLLLPLYNANGILTVSPASC